ncbi:hypothetical protein ASPACDRAFT_114385 [Aspergillus aculeatus ATCC 16872]|uniref:Rhodopsin domain-containing protein n=1 Tax=Aspergillus aculeatus (strain ATCC 16872 / CBS 172.66 / WB 5094) TaxID=690307 RepID=A0A1L9X0I6_ASPA1|nr:uncharacterized protein ASPACDRAFT_114385 [Aspergillus aculeatus ATCC 16872]OJK01866.1 hypothetical protein ASPACDRAFT_114385 [Aspergillus aculeatus ATCC 16872]
MKSALAQGEKGYDHDNLRHVVITASCFALVISTLAVALRLWCRRITRTKVFLDDYLMIVALVFEYGITVAGVVLLYNGLGTHIIYVSPEQLVVYMKTLSTGTFLYTLCITFVKLSILALYKRIFSIRPMMQASNVVACIVILWCFGVCLIGAVTCMPFKKLWEPNLPGGCINLAQFYYGLQIPNILTDAIILVLPMKAVWNLQVPRSQKVMLSGIFLIGTTTLAFDIVRLVVMIQLSEAGGDITYDQVTASVWTCIEPMMGITAACLSNMRPLFTMLPRPEWSKNLSWRKNAFSLPSSDRSKTKSMEQKPNIHSTTVIRIDSSRLTNSSTASEREEV